MTIALVSPADRSTLHRVGQHLETADGSQSYPIIDGVARLVRPDRRRQADEFGIAYGAVRAAEGRCGESPAYYRALPYEDLSGQFTHQWASRARTYDTLLAQLPAPPQRIVDAGAGNCWLSARLARCGHDVLATDLNVDRDDGLGAHVQYDDTFQVAQAEIEALPVADASIDVLICNASAHYVPFADLVREAMRVLVADGTVIIADSPVYRDVVSGRTMVAEMHRYIETLGVRPAPFAGEGFLTTEAIDNCGLTWKSLSPLGWRGELRRRVSGLRARREAATVPLLIGSVTP